jgi:hypothetical protein
MRKVVDQGAPYYTQLNNKLAPMISCQCTAAMQCLEILGLTDKFYTGNWEQPEDMLRFLCTSPATARYAAERKLDLTKVEHPSEYSELLAFTINSFLETKVATATSISSELLLSQIDKGLPVQCSMSYMNPVSMTTYYHHVTLVGYDLIPYGDNIQERKYIINDPFGDIRAWVLKREQPGVTRGWHLEYTESEWHDHFNYRGLIYNKPDGVRA